MDKYTVDLDKVLNDFEYSELTDQYVKPAQSSTYSSSRMRNGNVKHSINNVFHSLNEYLSTDIDDKCEIVTDITLKQTENFDKPNVAKDNNLDSAVKITQNVHIDLQDGDKHREDSPISAKKGGEETNNYSILDAEIADNFLINTTNGKLESNDLKENDKPVEKETEIELENCSVVTDSATEITANKTEKTSELVVSDSQNEEEIIAETKHDKGYETTVTNLSEETIEKIIETEEKETNATVETVETKNKTIESEEEKINELAEENINEIEEKTIVTDLPDETNEKTIEIEEENKHVPISFNDTINLDDSELNRYLDELEDELEDRAEIKTTEEDLKSAEKEEIKEVESENQKDLVKNEDIKEDQCLSRPETLPLSHTTSEEKHDINLIGDPGSTPYNNVYVSEELPKEEEETREGSLSSSPTFSDISTDTTRSTTPSTETLNDDNEIAGRSIFIFYLFIYCMHIIYKLIHFIINSNILKKLR